MKLSAFVRLVVAASLILIGAAQLNAQIEVASDGKVGLGGVTSPAYSLHSAGSIGVAGDQKFVARYSSSDDYSSTFGWSHLQLGNNGPNWIVAGRTATGGSLSFIVNNTAGYSYGGFNGTTAMYIAANGDVGVGTTSPTATLDVDGAVKAAQGGFGRSPYSNWPLAVQGSASAFIEASGQAAITIAPNLSGYNYVVSDYFSGSAHLPLVLSGRGATNDLVLTTGGNVGIGVSSPSQRLHVDGTVRASSFISNTTTYADHVFKPDYRLPTLTEVEAHIAEKGHLPDIPSEAEAKANGIDLAAMQVKLLQKIEELTLYAIEQNKRLEAQQQEITALRSLR